MTDITNRDITTTEPQISGVTATGASQVQPSAASGTNETPLFDGTQQTDGISTTDRTDAYVSSTQTSGEKSAEMTALENKLVEKQSAVTDIDSKIEENNLLKEEKKNAYLAAGEAVKTTYSAYMTASQNYTAALNELNELKNSNIFESIFNTITQKVKQAESKVADLKNKAEKARKDYEKAVEERQTANEEYVSAVEEGIALKQDRATAESEVAAVQKEIQDLASKEANEQAESGSEAQQSTAGDGKTPPEGTTDQNSCLTGLSALQEAAKNNPELQAALDAYGDNITEADINELSSAYNVQLNSTDGSNAPETGATQGATQTPPSSPAAGETQTPPLANDPSYAQDLELLDSLREEARKEAEDFANQPNIFEMDINDVDKLVELFCGELTHGEVQHMGLELLDMVDEAAKIFETKLTATAYSKSGAMATSDSATAKEHSEAQANFTEAVLQVSDIVNNTDVEFYNVSDQSNFELASHTLDRINQGEYIKTDTLEKQTSTVKNIRVTEKTADKTDSNDDKYRQYSDAILDELNGLISDPEDGITEEEYNSIKTTFDLKASKDMESAFEYLEEEARKHNITSAIENYGN